MTASKAPEWNLFPDSNPGNGLGNDIISKRLEEDRKRQNSPGIEEFFLPA
jgi:hypothetical protein